MQNLVNDQISKMEFGQISNFLEIMNENWYLEKLNFANFEQFPLKKIDGNVVPSMVPNEKNVGFA